MSLSYTMTEAGRSFFSRKFNPQRMHLVLALIYNMVTSSVTPIISFIKVPSCTSQGCSQVGKAISLPATAVVAGLILILRLTMSHSVVEVALY